MGDVAEPVMLTCDMDAFGPFRVKIEAFEGTMEAVAAGFSAAQSDMLLAHLFVEAQLMEDGVPMGLPSRTSYAPLETHCRWNDTLTFPHIRYWHLPRNAELRLHLRSKLGPRQFVTLGEASFRLFSKNGRLKSGRKKNALNLAHGSAEGGGEEAQHPPAAASGGGAAPPKGESMDRLEKLIQRYDRNAMDRTPWLDRLAFRRIEQINQSRRGGDSKPVIMVEMERWDLTVMFGAKDYSVVPNGGHPSLPDPEVGCDSPVEHKHRKLARSLHRAIVDRNLQPDSEERKQIEALLKAPWDWADLTGTKMSPEHKQLLWRYRFALTKEKAALTKFFNCVDWADQEEVEQAVELTGEWERQVSIDINDALQLLSANFTHPKVREAAARRVARADDAELLGYLLQLVQALRYESPGREGDTLLNLLVNRAEANLEIANYLHWYIFCQQLVEAETLKDAKGRPRHYERAQRKLMTALERTERGRATITVLEQQHDLVAFLSKLAQDIKNMRESRAKKVERLKAALASTHSMIFGSGGSGVRLNMNPNIIATGLVADDAEVFKSAMMPLGISFLTHMPQLDVKEADRLQYKYRIIFKDGDDLRQDQLVLQMIRLMDRELKLSGLDLQLVPYRALATSPTTGIVERVDSSTLSRVLAEYGKDIQRYLRQHCPDSSSPYGIAAEVMDTYVKSTAGYCVITYLMGVGDRHLDNVLLTPKGNLFHIDFGYLLGRDPKPLPPPFKLVKEMVEAMGGQQSQHYRLFQQHCCEAYIILRRRAELFINLMMLMKDANIPDISGVPGRPEDPERQLYKFWERFHLEMSNEEAYAHMQALISQSQSALVPQVVEWAHKLKQDYWTA